MKLSQLLFNGPNYHCFAVEPIAAGGRRRTLFVENRMLMFFDRAETFTVAARWFELTLFQFLAES